MRTGDYGALFENELYITGRLKEVLIINGHNVYPNDIKVSLQTNIISISSSPIAVFPIVEDSKERVVIAVELFDVNSNFNELSDMISKTVNKYFDFSPIDIVFSKINTFSRTDNGKLKIHKLKSLYESGELEIIYSMKENRILEATESQVAVGKQDEISIRVKRIFEEVIGMIVNDLDDSFLELGGDSFHTLELISKLEQEFELKVDLKEVLNNPSINGVSEYIKHKLMNDDEGLDNKVDLYDECVLDEEIKPENEYKHSIDEAKNFFLTGSTGFLGAHFIRSFINSYKGNDLKIYCHVRAQSVEKGFQRIKNNMEHYKC